MLEKIIEKASEFKVAVQIVPGGFNIIGEHENCLKFNKWFIKYAEKNKIMFTENHGELPEKEVLKEDCDYFL